MSNPVFPPTLTPELKDRFLSLACALSPENLTCDGELSRAEVKRRYNQIQKEWILLEKKAGCRITEDDAYSFGKPWPGPI